LFSEPDLNYEWIGSFHCWESQALHGDKFKVDFSERKEIFPRVQVFVGSMRQQEKRRIIRALFLPQKDSLFDHCGGKGILRFFVFGNDSHTLRHSPQTINT
jgi:hypothetical protein